MVESMYQKWLKKEEEWIGGYCAQTRKSSLLKVVPLTLIVTALLFGGITFLGSGDVEDLLMGGVGGLFLGLVIGIFYLCILFVSLRPSRYVQEIVRSVAELSMNEAEKEVLGAEMLEALTHEDQVLSYQMEGPKSKGTPARLVRTLHYFFQVGSTPYSVMIRMSDIAEVKASSEKKVATTRSGNMKTHHYFTLYTIGFYRKDRFEHGLADSELPDSAMGFFQESLRDRALEMVQREM